ncbi:MAG: M3 family oligoendopeptidase, partial [Phycisphaeraceae bacterium]
QKHYLASPALKQVEADPGLAIMHKEWLADVETFRTANVPLETKLTELNSEYDKTMGAMEVEFKGETYTLQQMGKFLEDTDRDTRQQAWQLSADRRMAAREKVDAIFEKMLDLRHRIAENAGFDNFRDYTWESRHRFDYTPEHCQTFADGVAAVCMPLVEQLDVERKKKLNLDVLRPWDSGVDPDNKPPLKPFDAADIDTFVAKTRTIFDRISPELGRQFATLAENNNLDLDSRKGKRPGGFQAALQASKQPFIFMNAAGLQRDVETLVHEGGHAFHFLASCDMPNLFVRHAPLEFCEVASMGMELIAADHYDVFYDNPEDAARAKHTQFEGIARKLTWIAVIDGFQHWLYTHPGHSAEQRTAAWLEILNRFSSSQIDWTGLEEPREAMWQRQLHLFHVPFYYIEYGIAQIGAMQVWQNYHKDPERTLSQLLKAFALGGTRPLPELFETAGAKFDFSEANLRPLIEAVSAELG